MLSTGISETLTDVVNNEGGSTKNAPVEQQNPEQVENSTNIKKKRQKMAKNENGEEEYDYYYSDDEKDEPKEGENPEKSENLNVIEETKPEQPDVEQKNPETEQENNLNVKEVIINKLKNENSENVENVVAVDDSKSATSEISEQHQSELHDSEETQTPEAVSQKEENGKKKDDQRTAEEKDLDNEIIHCFNTFQPPPVEKRSAIKQRLSKRRIEAIMSGSYDEAEEIDKYEKAFNYSLELEEEKKKEDNRIDILYGRYTGLQEKLQQENERYEQLINDFIKSNDAALAELKQKHAEELDEFSKKWADPSFLRQYNKPSSKLLQLREMERARAVSKLYQQAKEVKLAADKLQQEETNVAQAKIAAQMRIDKKKLLDKQQKEINRNQQHKEKVIFSYQQERDKSTLPLVTAIQQIRAKKDTIPLNTKQHTPTSTIQSASDSTGQLPISPRTHELYVAFRTEKKKTRLDVHPVDEKTLKTPKARNGTRSAIRRPVISSKSRFGARK